MSESLHSPQDIELLVKISPDLFHKYLGLQQQFDCRLQNASADQVEAIEAEFEEKVQSLFGWVSCPDCGQ